MAFYTLGCRVNQYETTALAELFIGEGYEVVDFSDKSDLYIINTCAVTAESERKSAQMIRRAVRAGGKVAVVGCYSQLNPTLGGIEGVSFIAGSKEKTAVFREAKKLLEGNDTQLLLDNDLNGYGYEYMSIGNEKNTLFSACRAFIKIQDGCNGKCSYCVIPKARGGVRSRPAEDIYAEAQRLADMGYKELVLTGIETSSYDYAPLSKLIQLMDKVEGIKRLRFGSLSPNSITDDFLEAAGNSAIFMPHIHLSLQSGSDRILKLMRRQYNKKQMCDKIEKIYDRLPGTLISSDIIVCFTTETEQDFLQSLDLVSDYGLSHIHAFPFSVRPGTAAAEMAVKVPAAEIKRRNERLIAHSEAVRDNVLRQRTGTKARVLVESVSAKDNICKGHTEDFLEAGIIPRGKTSVGDIIQALVLSHKNGILLGEETIG